MLSLVCQICISSVCMYVLALLVYSQKAFSKGSEVVHIRVL